MKLEEYWHIIENDLEIVFSDQSKRIECGAENYKKIKNKFPIILPSPTISSKNLTSLGMVTIGPALLILTMLIMVYKSSCLLMNVYFVQGDPSNNNHIG